MLAFFQIKELEESKLFEPDTRNVHNLRNLAEHFHVIRTSLEDLREHIEYLSRIHQNSAYSHFFQPKLDGQEYGAVRESLSHLLSQVKTMTRWVSSYVDHTDIVMNHLFNLFSLSISDFTSQIAVSTQQDSSSMITYVFSYGFGFFL
jgi:DNA repair ATPase RecN